MSRYVDPPGKILRHAGRIAAWQRGEKPAPVTVEWDLSNRCSLGCRRCHFAYTHTHGPLVGQQASPLAGEPGGDLADRVVVSRGLTEMALAGVKSVIWAGGGEPTLHPDWRGAVRHAQAQGLEQGMYTHGGHVDEGAGRLLSETMEWVVVSLDCADAESYAQYKQVKPLWFERACNGIRNIKAEKGECVVGASFLLGRDNWFDARRMLELGRSLGANYTTFRPLILYDTRAPEKAAEDTSWVVDAAALLQELARESDVECSPERFGEYWNWNEQGRGYSTCYGIAYSTVVTPNGKVWACCNRREFPGSCLGDLSRESFVEIWARHPGKWFDLTGCRVMCRLHPVNKQLSAVTAGRRHENFL